MCCRYIYSCKLFVCNYFDLKFQNISPKSFTNVQIITVMISYLHQVVRLASLLYESRYPIQIIIITILLYDLSDDTQLKCYNIFYCKCHMTFEAPRIRAAYLCKLRDGSVERCHLQKGHQPKFQKNVF